MSLFRSQVGFHAVSLLRSTNTYHNGTSLPYKEAVLGCNVGMYTCDVLDVLMPGLSQFIIVSIFLVMKSKVV